MATPENINKRIAELYDEAEQMGKWKQAAVALDHKRKAKRGELWRQAEGNNDSRQAYAESHADYIAICEQMAEAEGQYSRLKARHDIALAAMSVWQTVTRLQQKELETLRSQ